MGERSGHDTPQGKARRDGAEPVTPKPGAAWRGKRGRRPAVRRFSCLSWPVLTWWLSQRPRKPGQHWLAGTRALLAAGWRMWCADPGGQQLVATLRRCMPREGMPGTCYGVRGAGRPRRGRRRGLQGVGGAAAPDGSVGGVVVAGLGMNRQRRGTPDPGRETGAAERHGQLHPRPAEEDFAAPRGLPVLPGTAAGRAVCHRPPLASEPAGLDVVMLPDGAAVLMAGTAEHVQGPAGEAVHLRMVLRDMLRRGAGPAGALAAFRGLATESAQTREAGACVVRVDPASGELSYASSGDSVLVLCPPAGEASFLPSPGGEPPGQGIILAPRLLCCHPVVSSWFAAAGKTGQSRPETGGWLTWPHRLSPAAASLQPVIPLTGSAWWRRSGWRRAARPGRR